VFALFRRLSQVFLAFLLLRVRAKIRHRRAQQKVRTATTAATTKTTVANGSH